MPEASTTSLLLAFALAIAIAAALIPVGVHLGFRAPRTPKTLLPSDLGLAYEPVDIPTVRGRSLAGWLLRAPDAARTVVVLHGWGSNSALMLPIALPLRRAGLNVLLFDARNHGASDGDTFSSLPRFAEDLAQAIAWLKREHPAMAREIAVIGHSVGAGAALFEATRNPAIGGVISIAAFADPDELTDRSLARLPLPRFVGTLIKRYVQWVIGHRFEEIAPVNTIARVPCPVLLVHGDADRTVPIDDARRIAAAGTRAGAGAGRNVRLTEIPGADHGSADKIEAHAGALLKFLAEDCGWSGLRATGPQGQLRRQLAPAARTGETRPLPAA
jgi:pimeloyl-ACP methyl ester carboxylesterase